MRPVLLVEDDDDIRVLAEWSLRSAGLEVVACASGAQALAALGRSEFALIILDFMMPDMSGQDVLAQLATRSTAARPPVAIFSARPRDVVLRECAEIELAAILAKPFDPVELANQVRSLIMQPL